MRLIVALVLTVSIAALGGESDTGDIAVYCEKGWTALRAGKPDSSVVYFLLAHTHGMSRDSLYYLWAETYVERGILDSALALNYAAGSPSDSAFGNQVRKQRYVIYSGLGWEDKARVLLDTIGPIREQRPSRAIPEFRLAGRVGYLSAPDKRVDLYPWTETVLPDSLDIDRGVSYYLRGGFRLKLPFWGTARSALGVVGNLDKPYYVTGPFLDSLRLNKTATGRFSVERILEKFSATLALSVKNSYLGYLTALPLVELGYVNVSTKSTRFASVGYGTERIVDGGALENRWFWAAGYVDRSIREGKSLALLFTLNGDFTKASFGNSDYVQVFYVDTVIPGELPQHYTNETYQTLIDTASLSPALYQTEVWSNKKDVDVSGLYGTEISATISTPSIAASPSLSFHTDMPLGIRASLGAGWRFDYYLDQFRWVELNKQGHQSLTDPATFLVYSRKDDEYFILSDGPRYEGQGPSGFTGSYDDFIEIIQPDPVSTDYAKEVSERRIDNTISAKLSFSRDIRRLGSLRINGRISKTWSTLSNRAPIDIPVWSWSASASWQKTIKPRKKHAN